MNNIIVWIFSVGLTVAGAASALGQNYPSKSIRIIAGQPGGASDFIARIVATGLSSSLGQPTVVENRGSNVAGEEFVARATPDGYTLLVAGSELWIGPLIRKASYDAISDFSSVSLLIMSPNVLVVHPSLPVKSVRDLIVLAKARPGDLSYASATVGSPPQLAAELLKAMTGANIVGVPYRGSATGLLSLIGGETQFAFYPASQVMEPYVKPGRLKALAVTTAEPSSLAPGLPTVAVSGNLPGYELASMISLWAPGKTPVAIVTRLNQEIARVLNQPDVKEKIINTGAEVVASSPEELTARMKYDIARLGKVIKDAGIKPE